MNQDPFSHLVITRKRKKYKFANFESFENSFSHTRGEDGIKTWQKLKQYLGDKPLILELAAGNAQFSLELAKQNPNYNYIAIDIKSDRLYSGAKQALREGVKNIAFLRTHMNELEEVFKPGSIEVIWLTFPDPHPKKRSAKHRLTHDSYLRKYRNILSDTGKLKFKTDNHDLFLWSLEQFVAKKWQVLELSFDLHESNLPDEYKIKTHYEERFLKQDLKINYCTTSKL